MPFPVSGAFLRTVSTGKAFGKNTAALPGEDDFSLKPPAARPCRWKQAVRDLRPVNRNGFTASVSSRSRFSGTR